MNRRLIDLATATTHELLLVVSPALREEERREVWALFFEAVERGLLDYEEMRRAEEKRKLQPSKN